MRELRQAKRTTQHALNVGKDTLKFARKMQQADNKTRLKTTGKLLALITLGISKWFVRETWHAACKKPVYKRKWDPYTERYENKVVGYTQDKDMLAIGNAVSACGRKITKRIINNKD